MNTRRLGKTGLMVSEIGFGGEWLERHPEDESIELIHYASSMGIKRYHWKRNQRKPQQLVYPGTYRIDLER